MREYPLVTRCRLHVSPPIAAACVGQTRARDGDPPVWGAPLHPLPTPTRVTSQFADCSGPTPSPRRAGVSRLLQLRGQGLVGEVRDVSLRYRPFSGWRSYSMYAASRERCSVVFSRSAYMAAAREWFVAAVHILFYCMPQARPHLGDPCLGATARSSPSPAQCHTTVSLGARARPCAWPSAGGCSPRAPWWVGLTTPARQRCLSVAR
jgi:hypothetical protein